jgi:hypothetical protein
MAGFKVITEANRDFTLGLGVKAAGVPLQESRNLP